MKTFSIDTNFNTLGPDFPAISHNEATRLSLKDGEKVTVNQDEDVWVGIVHFDESMPDIYQWYVALIY